MHETQKGEDMSRWVAVFHYWWMESKGWDVEELDAKTEYEAECQAALKKNNREHQFKRVSYKIIEISDEEHIVKPERKKFLGLF